MSIRKILPSWLKRWLRKQKELPALNKEMNYMKGKILQFSFTYIQNKTTSLANLLVVCHVLEKGITMPDRRMGFGYNRVRDIISSCNDIISKWGSEFVEVQAALSDLKQYYDVHRDANFQLPDDITDGIEKLIPHLSINDENCYIATKADFFKPYTDFSEFAKSRHSVRWFDNTPVDDDKLLAAIELAQTAPSACNRQATRVKIISSPAGKQLCCALHKGNRGFGDKADKWLLITTDLHAWSHTDALSLGYIDAGIFTMNLLYSLHYYGFVACPLNGQMGIEKYKELQSKLNLPESEIPVVFIVVGNPTNHFMIPKSRRLNLNDIVQTI